MRTLSPLVAVIALLLTVASLPIVGGVLFALFFFFPLFLLALVTVIAGLEHRTVRQHDASMSPTAWRDGSDGMDANNRHDFPAASRADGERRAA
jgi:hypothetical protein